MSFSRASLNQLNQTKGTTMLRNLLNADVEEYKKEALEIAEYEDFKYAHPHLEKIVRWIRIYKYTIRMWINIHILCPILGHDMQICTFFEISKGVVASWCKRCKMTASDRLY